MYKCKRAINYSKLYEYGCIISSKEYLNLPTYIRQNFKNLINK